MSQGNVRFYTAGEPLKIGDPVVIHGVTVYRKWWQIWKPRAWTEDRAFTITTITQR